MRISPGNVISSLTRLAMSRAMSRTAWSYESRVAWHDQASGQIAEVPDGEPA